MKSLKIILSIIIILIIVQTSYSQDITSDTTLANQYFEIANEFLNNYELDSSRYYLEKSQNLYLEHLGEKSLKNSSVLNLYGTVYYYESEFDIALEYYLKSLEIQKGIIGENNSSVANSYCYIGNIYADKLQNDIALEYYFKALELYKQLFGEKSSGVATAYMNIGIIYKEKSEFEKALEYHFKSLDIKLDIFDENSFELAKSYANIGTVYGMSSIFDKALEYNLKALKIIIDLFGENNPVVANMYINIANVYGSNLENDKALEYYFKSLKIQKELIGENNIYIAGIYINIGQIYTSKLEYDKGLEFFIEGLNIVKNIAGENHQWVINAYNNIGNIYIYKSDFYNALNFHQKCIASCLHNYKDTSNIYFIPEIKDFTEWNRLLESLYTKATIFKDTTITLLNIETLSRLEIALKHYQACDTLISQVRKEITTQSDKIALGEKANKVYKEAISVCYYLPKSYMEQAFYFSEKSKTRVLLDEIAEKNASQKAGISDSLIKNEKKIIADISFYQNLISEELDSLLLTDYNDKLFYLKRQQETIIEQFKTDYPKYAELKYVTKVPQIFEIQKIIDDKTALRSYSIGDSMIYIFTITQKTYDIDTISKNSDFENQISNLVYSLVNSDKKNNLKLVENSRIIYKQLFPKYTDFDKNIKNIIIIPDDSLSLIPFEALLTEDLTGDINNLAEYPFLIKKYAVSYSPSASLFYNLKTSENKIPKYDIAIIAPVFSQKDTLLIEKSESLTEDEIAYRNYLGYDESTFERYIKPLYFTEIEANSIFKIYGKRKAQLCMYEAANEQFVKSDKLCDFKILLFATHAVSNTDEPNMTGIILAQDTTGGEDGFLHSNEIYNLNLNADLVSLSACETAVGKVVNGEGVMDLSRAFFYAGTKNVIASLWEVDDKSTSELMINFYQDYMDKNTEISESLQKAKLEIINSTEEKYRHPKYWAPFLLIGK